MPTPKEEQLAREKAIYNEQRKYQSTYINTVAAGLIVAGVIAPIIAAAKDGAGSGVLALIPICIIVSAGLHFAATTNLERLL